MGPAGDSACQTLLEEMYLTTTSNTSFLNLDHSHFYFSKLEHITPSTI